MNGPQDVGGMDGFGPIAPEPDEPVFHDDWEARALGVTLCAGALGAWTIDESRHARESLPPAVYYSSTYYAIWIAALETLLARHGMVDADGRATGPAPSTAPGAMAARVLRAERVPAVLAAGSRCDRPLDTDPRFGAGDRVRARNIHPAGHTRLPRYVRGRVGTVAAVRDGYVFPDTNAHGLGEQPQTVYTVVFDGRELWGADADPTVRVSVDAWESYLEPA